MNTNANTPICRNLGEIAKFEWLKSKFDLHPGKLAKELKKHYLPILSDGFLRGLAMDTQIVCNRTFNAVEVHLRGEGILPTDCNLHNAKQIAERFNFNPIEIASFIQIHACISETTSENRRAIGEELVKVSREAWDLLVGSDEKPGIIDWAFQEAAKILKEERAF